MGIGSGLDGHAHGAVGPGHEEAQGFGRLLQWKDMGNHLLDRVLAAVDDLYRGFGIPTLPEATKNLNFFEHNHVGDERPTAMAARANHDIAPNRPNELEAQLHHGFRACAFDDDIGQPPRSEFAHTRQGVSDLVEIDEVMRAELSCQRPLKWVSFAAHDDDGIGPSLVSGDHGGKALRAHTQDDDRLAELHLRLRANPTHPVAEY